MVPRPCTIGHSVGHLMGSHTLLSSHVWWQIGLSSSFHSSWRCSIWAFGAHSLFGGSLSHYDLHNGRTNHYSFKMQGKEFVLRPMSPNQVIADKQATHRGENGERVSHQKENERHKPKLSASMMSENKNLVLFATKREIREVCENPSSVLHYVLVSF